MANEFNIKNGFKSNGNSTVNGTLKATSVSATTYYNVPGISGNGSTGQIGFFNGTTSLTGSTNLKWDSTNNILRVIPNSPSTFAGLQITNGSSGIGTGDGVLFGYDTDNNAKIKTLDANSLIIDTYGVNAMVFKSGNVSSVNNHIIGGDITDLNTGVKFQVQDTSGSISTYPIRVNHANSKLFFVNGVGQVGINKSTNSLGAILDISASGSSSSDIAFRVRNSSDSDNIFSVNGSGITTKSIKITSGATNGYVLTSDASGNATWGAISSAVPQTDVIYIDSANGADNGDTNRGNVEKPYASVEYVLANVVNTGTVTGTTTSGSATISSVNNTTNIKVGQYLTGTGIPFNTTVLSKTSNSITISTTATASGSNVALTWWTPKLLRLNGDFTATSNWYKQGFYFDSNPSVSVQWGAFSLYEVTTLSVIPYINNSEFNYYGTTSTSKWFYNVANVQNSDTTMSFKFTSIHSNTTSYVLTLGTSPYYYGNYRFNGKILNAKLGYACGIGWSFQNVYFDIDYTYGLLGGVSYEYFQGLGYWNGSITTPASVYAINDGGGSGSSNMVFSNGTITGSVTFNGKGGGVTRVPFYSNIAGSTTCNLKGVIMYGNVPDATILNGNVDLYGYHSSYLYCDAGYNRIYKAPAWGIVSRNSSVVEINADIAPYNIQALNTSKMIINAKVSPGGATVAAGAKLIVNGELNTTSMSISGELVNNNDIILTSGSITINSGGKLRNYRKMESTVVSTTVPLIVKDAGDLYLYPGSYLKVANAKGPLKCSANTSASKNIYLFNSITNCDGSTYGLQIAFDGSSYAANDLVGGLLYENTNY